MGWTRHTGAVVSLAVLASLVANYAIHRHFEARSHRSAITEQQASDEALLADFPPVSSTCPISGIPAPLQEIIQASHDGVVNALQTGEAGDAPPTALPVGSSDPGPVPVPQDAVPIQEGATKGRESTPGNDAVRNVIEDELSETSREERDIWFDELKSLPAGVVRDLLQVRKQLRSLPRALHLRADTAKAAPNRRVAEVPAEQASQTRRTLAPDWAATIAALEQASMITRHNLANSTTPGFKRFRVMLVDTYGIHWTSDTPSDESPSTLQFDGSRLAPLTLDMEKGSLKQTERALDLAIDGDGFFVAVQNERAVYSRCGAMSLDLRRRLCLVAGDVSAVVHPEITIPADAREIQINAQGQVSVLRKLGADPELVGQLQLARFASPTRLRPIGGTLLVPTALSGVAEVDAPDAGGRGVIQQSCLELSNADPEVEQAELDQWQSLLKSLPSVSHPVTARGEEPTAR